MPNREPPHYFPVKPEPLRMSPGLHRLGHDFGNGPLEGLFFQQDRCADEYRIAKSRVLASSPGRLRRLTDARALELQQHAYDWMLRTYEREHGRPPVVEGGRAKLTGGADTGEGGGGGRDFEALSLALQEDFALLQCEPDGSDRLVMLSVCFPSGWRPETLLGKSFEHIHVPVPEFEEGQRRSHQMVAAMVHRGPYVRFVWTLCADARLDHHPDESPRDPWTEGSEGILRVERQVTVPFPDCDGSLFLIRTYLYRLSELSDVERSTLHEAVVQLPESIRDYKGLTSGHTEILRRLR